MPNLYAGLEAVKRAGDISGANRDAELLRTIEAESRRIDNETLRRFIPETATRRYRWPPLEPSRAYRLWLDQDLLSVSLLESQAEDSSPVVIPTADYFLEPQTSGPPYRRVEIDLSSSSAFQAGSTPQRSILVTGSWGYGSDTNGAGTVSSGLAADAAATSLVCSDASLIDVGETLLIGSEQLYVSARAPAQVGSQQLNGALTADRSGTSVTVTDGTQFHAGETILVDSERMYVESISGNVLTVIRAYDGSTLAAHTNTTAVQAYRTLTVQRGVNGTTAATHANAAAISKYVPPLDIGHLAIAAVLFGFQQSRAGWGRNIGTGEGAVELRGSAYSKYRQDIIATYTRRRRHATV